MITVVSGLPRSGTSLMMQMLAAGGLPLLTDGQRAADLSNPRGYFEWEAIKSLPRNPACIAAAEGKAVKVISSLLPSLPSEYSYKIIFMERAMEEVVVSQAAMIQKLGTEGPTLAPEAMAPALEAHVKHVKALISSRPEIAICCIQYHQALGDPEAAACAVQEFLGIPLDLAAMAAQPDPALYRQHHTLTSGK